MMALDKGDAQIHSEEPEMKIGKRPSMPAERIGRSKHSVDKRFDMTLLAGPPDAQESSDRSPQG